MTRVIMHGCNGRMGQMITGIVAADPEVEIVAGIDVSDHIQNTYPVFKTIADCDVEADVAVSDRKGIFEYVLGDEQNPKLLNIRVFEKSTIRSVYTKQTQKAKAEGVSNCPYCAEGEGVNKTHVWKETEMDADHVTAWSKGGSTTIDNCQMLCKTHNRMKGNR